MLHQICSHKSVKDVVGITIIIIVPVLLLIELKLS